MAEGYDPAMYYSATTGAAPASGMVAQPAASAQHAGTKRPFTEVMGVESVNKRMKLDGDPVPSKVLHVRGLPPDCSEQELIQLACAFGRVVNILLLKGKNQAFVQMQDEATATALVQYYTSVRATIRGKSIYFQFSNRSEISQPSNVETPNHILLVTILNVTFPVTIDVLQQVFQNYPVLEKLVIFQKSGLQALVQFSNVDSAARAKAELDGKDIYSGCCTLKIQYSSLPTLNVKYNNDKSRDFTNPSLPTGDMSGSAGGGGLPSALPTAPINPMMGFMDPLQQSMYGHMTPDQSWNPYAMAAGAAAAGYGMPNAFGMQQQQQGGSVLIVSGLPPEGIDPDVLFTLFGVYGDVIRVKIMFKSKDKALVQFTSPQHAQTALTHLKDIYFRGNQLNVNVSRLQSINMPRNEDQVRLVTMAVAYLSDGANLTKDYTNSPLHRYTRPGSKNFQHITAPTNVLHLSSLPESATEEELRSLFSTRGQVVNFKFFDNNKRMGLVEMASKTEAIEALIAFHYYQLHDSQIKVSFSRSSIRSD